MTSVCSSVAMVPAPCLSGSVAPVAGSDADGYQRSPLVRQALAELATRLFHQQTLPVLASPAAVRDFLQLSLADRGHEVFAVVFLDAQNRLIAVSELFRGTLTQTSVYPREVVVEALAHRAAAVILAHNHPSGCTEPSLADEALTGLLKQALSLVDVRVLDHFIVTGAQLVSLAELGRL